MNLLAALIALAPLLLAKPDTRPRCNKVMACGRLVAHRGQHGGFRELPERKP